MERRPVKGQSEQRHWEERGREGELAQNGGNKRESQKSQSRVGESGSVTSGVKGREGQTGKSNRNSDNRWLRPRCVE